MLRVNEITNSAGSSKFIFFFKQYLTHSLHSLILHYVTATSTAQIWTTEK